MPMQNARDLARTEIQSQTREIVRVRHAPDAPQPARAPDAPDAPRPDVADFGPVPRGGGRVIVDEQGDRTAFTVVSVPPQLMPLARMAQETAFGLLGLIAAIIILGPFARMFARRMDRKHEMKATVDHNRALQEQVAQLQQSIDAMSVEVERIGESQRFQSKLLVEKKSGSAYTT
jgi:hypothetical protein